VIAVDGNCVDCGLLGGPPAGGCSTWFDEPVAVGDYVLNSCRICDPAHPESEIGETLALFETLLAQMTLRI